MVSERLEHPEPITPDPASGTRARAGVGGDATPGRGPGEETTARQQLAPELEAVLARDALTDLTELLRGPGRLQLVDREPWRLGNLRAEEAQDASVLILFGPAAPASATSESEPPAPGSPAPRPRSPGASVRVGDTDVLILVRASSLRQHAGQPAFPGGRVDPEDREAADPSIEAALREAVEETGLDRSGVRVLGRAEPVPLPISSFLVTPVLAWWERPTPVDVVDAAESAQVFRVPLRQLLDPAHRHLATVTRGRRTHRTPAFTVDSAQGPVTVWGFTGILLDRLFAAAGWEVPWDTGRRIPAPL